MTTHLSSIDLEILSAYLDGQLNAIEQTRLHQRLNAQPELRRALEDLRRTRIILRSAPRRRAPRNFTLTPQMVPQRRRSWFPLVPSLGFASAMATISLIVTLSFQFLPGLRAAQMASSVPPAAAPLAASAPNPALKAQDSATESTGSPIIVWGSGGGRGGGGGSGEAVGMGGGAATEPGQSLVEITPPAGAAMLTPSETPTPSVENAVPLLQGTGPILGIRPPEEQALIAITEVPSPDLPYAARDAYQLAPAANPEPDLLGLDILFGVLALATGAGAIYLRRRT